MWPGVKTEMQHHKQSVVTLTVTGNITLPWSVEICAMHFMVDDISHTFPCLLGQIIILLILASNKWDFHYNVC